MRLVLFDIDGTLIRGQGSGRMALERAFQEVFALPETPRTEAAVSFNGALDPDIIAAIAAFVGIDNELFVASRAALQSSYLEHLQAIMAGGHRFEVLPGVQTLVARLAAHPDYATGLLTGNIEPGARQKLSHTGLNRFFAAGGFGDDGATRAEVAKVARQRMERLVRQRVAPERVWVIGDSVADVRCGRANGFRTVAVTTGWTTRTELQATGPDLLLDDLASTDDILRAFESDEHPCLERESVCPENVQDGE